MNRSRPAKMAQLPTSAPVEPSPAEVPETEPRLGIDIGAETVKAVLLRGEEIEDLGVALVRGRPLERVKEILEQALARGFSSLLLGLTGAGALQAAPLLGIEPVDEPNAIAAACNLLHPQARTVVEMGRESQKYLRFTWDETAGRLLLDDANLSSKCAAGSGSFLDHMARRLNYPSIEEFARVAHDVEHPASLSGRCAVFTESDIVHLYQKGTPRERIAAGIHQAICRNYRSAIARGREFASQVLFIGGVSLNPAVRKYLARELGLAQEQIIVPAHNRALAAIGAALRAPGEVDLAAALAVLTAQLEKPLEYAGAEPLRLTSANRQAAGESNDDLPRALPVAALGVDIGSVSTKAALITEIEGKVRLLASHYRRTDGDPLAAVRDTVKQIHRQVQEAGFA